MKWLLVPLFWFCVHTCLFAQAPAPALNLDGLQNPVWSTKDNLRDPSVLKTKEGYLIFYSRFNYLLGPWNSPKTWTVASVFTKDFIHFENNHDISHISCASPGDCVQWGGRWVLPYQRYPFKPVELAFSESQDLKTWSQPTPFLTEALALPWNTERRVIDPTFVVVGNSLHCFFVGSTQVVLASGRKVHANLIGHAVSQDPSLQKWMILTPDQPVIGTSTEAPDGAENLTIFKTGAYWTMIYSEGLVHQHIARATSRDLITWTKTGPVNLPVQSWMAHKYGAPYVWSEGNQWMMILMGENAESRTTFGLLSSSDGENWNLLQEKEKAMSAPVPK